MMTVIYAAMIFVAFIGGIVVGYITQIEPDVSAPRDRFDAWRQNAKN